MQTLSFEETKNLLEKYKIPFADAKVCQNQKEAISFAREIGYPLVLKIVSPDILHKTDVGGVRTGIEKERDIKRAFNEIISSIRTAKPNVKIEGILVQKHIFGREVVAGMKRDPTFGPVLMFGLGGIFVESIKDISLRIVPVDKKEANKMIKEIKGFQILKGARGQKPVNIGKIIEIIVKLSKLSLVEKGLKEIDLNPIIVNEKEAFVVDARFLL